jgi:hypothetical protein
MDTKQRELIEKCALVAESFKRFASTNPREIADEIRLLKKGRSFKSCPIKQRKK